nr:zinc finger, CCHC-type [Tanacetum cinerariifolium]
MRRIFIMCCFDVRLLRLLCAEFVVGGLLTGSHGLLFRTGMRGSLTDGARGVPRHGNANHIRTLGDYSKPSHERYMNTIELPKGNNVVPLRSDTIQLVQNACSLYGLRSKDSIQHLKDFFRIVDSVDLNGDTRNTTRLRLLYFSLYDQAIIWLDRLPTGSISTWDDLITHFLAHFFPPGRTTKLRNNILMFQQCQDESLYDAWTRFQDLLQKVHHHGRRLRKLRPEVAWETIEDLSQYKEEGWNDPIVPEEESLDYENPDLE